MKKRVAVLFLILALCVSLFTLAVGATDAEEDATGLWGTKLTVFGFVSLILAAVLIVTVAVLCIVKRHKLAEGVKTYKSELKKITWYSWPNVVRGTVFVVVTVVALAIVIGLLDFAFFRGQFWLTSLK